MLFHTFSRVGCGLRFRGGNPAVISPLHAYLASQYDALCSTKFDKYPQQHLHQCRQPAHGNGAHWHHFPAYLSISEPFESKFIEMDYTKKRFNTHKGSTWDYRSSHESIDSVLAVLLSLLNSLSVSHDYKEQKCHISDLKSVLLGTRPPNEARQILVSVFLPCQRVLTKKEWWKQWHLPWVLLGRSKVGKPEFDHRHSWEYELRHSQQWDAQA